MHEIFEFRSFGICFDLRNLAVFTSTFCEWVLLIVLGTYNYYFLEREMGCDQLEGGQIFGYELGNIESELIVSESISKVIFGFWLEKLFGFVFVKLG